MTATAAPRRTASEDTVRWSLPARVVTAFSGTPALVLKILLLAVVNAAAIWAGAQLAGDEKWPALALLVASTVVLDAVYLVPRAPIPLKFLLPGTFFLLGFQVIPVIYTAQIAFTNYSTGHILAAASGLIVSAIASTPAPSPPTATYTAVLPSCSRRSASASSAETPIPSSLM